MNDIQESVNNSDFGKFPSAGSPVPARNSLGIVVKIVVGAVILTVVGAGVALGARIWDPLWNPFRPNPEQVIGRMAQRLKGFKTVHSNFNLSIETTGPQSTAASIHIEGDSNNANPQSPMISANLNSQFIGNEPGKNLSFKGEIREVKNASYFKLDDLNISSELEFFLALFGIKKDKFIGQWIKVNKEDLKKIENTDNKPKLSKDEQDKIAKKIEDLFKRKKIYKIKEMPDIMVGKREEYHYVLSLDREGLTEIIPKLINITAESSGKSSENILKEFGINGTNELTQFIGQFFDKIKGLDIEIWIGKKDYLLYRVKIKKEIEASALGENTKGNIVINLDLSLSKFGQAVKIEPPQKFLDWNDVISSISSQLNYLESISKQISTQSK